MADVTITQATVNHALTATTPDATSAEIRPSHWNATHAASFVLAASAVVGLFSNANGISFGTSGDAITGSYSQSTHDHPYDAAGAAAAAYAAAAADLTAHLGVTTTTTGGVDIKATHGAAGMTLAVPAYITTYAAQSVQTQPAGNIAGVGFTSTTTAGTEIKGTLGTNGLSLAVPAYLTAAVGGGGAGTGATTATTAGTQIKATLGTDGLSLAYPAALTTARASTDAVGLNTALTGNGVAWTVNSSGISLNIPAFLTTAALSNHSHGNPTLALTNLSGTTASNSDGLTLSLSANAPGGGAGFTKSRFNPFMEAVAAEGQLGQGTLHFHPVPDPDNFCFDRMYIDVRGTEGTQTNSTGSYTISLWAGFYTRNASSLSLLASSSTTLGLTKSGTVRASVNNGPRVMTMGWTTTITQADLWLGIVSRTTSAGQNLYTLSNYMASDVNSNFSGILGAASAATAQNVLGLGVFTVSTAGIPNSVAFSNINGSASQFLRVPLYYFVNGTV